MSVDVQLLREDGEPVEELIARLRMLGAPAGQRNRGGHSVQGRAMMDAADELERLAAIRSINTRGE